MRRAAEPFQCVSSTFPQVASFNAVIIENDSTTVRIIACTEPGSSGSFTFNCISSRYSCKFSTKHFVDLPQKALLQFSLFIDCCMWKLYWLQKQQQSDIKCCHKICSFSFSGQQKKNYERKKTYLQSNILKKPPKKPKWHRSVLVFFVVMIIFIFSQFSFHMQAAFICIISYTSVTL